MRKRKIMNYARRGMEKARLLIKFTGCPLDWDFDDCKSSDLRAVTWFQAKKECLKRYKAPASRIYKSIRYEWPDGWIGRPKRSIRVFE